MTDIHEIAPDVYRISIFVDQFNLQFNHFLVNDEQPLLFHAGMKHMFPALRDAVASLIDPSTLRWICFSHFEVDEVGSLNHWLDIAPHAHPACSPIGAIVNLADFADRPPHALQPGEPLATGKYHFLFHPTPHLPHGWDAGMLFETTHKTLFCSDLFHQSGNVKPLIESDIVLERTKQVMVEYQAGPLMEYLPYTVNTRRLLHQLADFNPATLAIMHGSSFTGDARKLLHQLDPILKEVYDREHGQ